MKKGDVNKKEKEREAENMKRTERNEDERESEWESLRIRRAVIN